MFSHETQAGESQICSGEVSWGLAAESRRDTGTPKRFLKPLVPQGSMQDGLFLT